MQTLILISNALLALVAVGVAYYSLLAASLFRGDMLYRVFVATGAAGGTIVVFATSEMVIQNVVADTAGILLFQSVITVCLLFFTVSLLSLVRWGRSSPALDLS